MPLRVPHTPSLPTEIPASALGDAHIFFKMLKYGDFSGNPINRHPDES
jgi:hypothetical protein